MGINGSHDASFDVLTNESRPSVRTKRGDEVKTTRRNEFERVFHILLPSGPTERVGVLADVNNHSKFDVSVFEGFRRTGNQF